MSARKPTTTKISLRGPAAASVRGSARGGKRVKLRAREHARLQCQNLELDIMNLRQEIATLETTRKLLYARMLNRADDPSYGSFEKIVREFYALSHAGYHKVVWRKAQNDPVDMEQFMRACFDDSMAVGAHALMAPGGLDSYLATMEQMMVVMDSPKVSILVAKVRANETDATATVAIKTRCASWLTAALLDALFPHLAEWFPWLRTKLIGREVVTIGEGDFTFSTYHGRIVRVDLRLDQTASILKLAESMEELSILKGEWTPRSDICEVLEEDELEGRLHPGGELPDRSATSTVKRRFEDVSDDESKRSNEYHSPMDLQHLLSPEREDDDNQWEAEGDQRDTAQWRYERAT